MTKVYLAARYEWRDRMTDVADYFGALGMEVTSRWIYGACEGLSDAEAAKIDLEDIDKADVLICFSDEHRGVGRHIEVGYAMGTGKHVFIVGESESVFHALPRVTIISDLGILAALEV